MASRYGPGVPIYQPGAHEVTSALAAALASRQQQEDREWMRSRLEDADRRAQAADELERKRREIELYRLGHRDTAPRLPVPDLPPEFEGQRIGLAKAATEREADPLTRGIRFTPYGPRFDRPVGGSDMLYRGGGPGTDMLYRGGATGQPLTEGGASPLAAALAHVTAPGPDEGPRLKALPGAFVPGLGFTPRPIFEAPMALVSPELRQGGIDPRFVRLPGGGYLDTTATPEARAAAAAQAEHARQLGERRMATTALGRILGLPEEHLTAAGEAALDPKLLIDAMRARAALAESAGGDVNWQTLPTEDGYVQVNPRTGQTRPLGITPPPRSTSAEDARIRATQAAAAIARLDPPMTPSMQRRYDEQVQRILDLYGFRSREELAAAMRTFGPDVTASDELTPDQSALLAAAIAATNAQSASAAAPAADNRRVITKDQADYLREVRGMSDAEISRLYIVR